MAGIATRMIARASIPSDPARRVREWSAPSEPAPIAESVRDAALLAVCQRAAIGRCLAQGGMGLPDIGVLLGEISGGAGHEIGRLPAAQVEKSSISGFGFAKRSRSA